MTDSKYRVRSRTIDMPEHESALISTAAKYLGVSAHQLIQLAIKDKLTAVYAEMLSK